MAVDAFKDVNWSDNEPVSTDLLNQMASNTRFLFERAPQMWYTSYSTRKDTGVKIACGVTTFSAGTPLTAGGSGGYTIATVPFGSFFTVGCKPTIAHGIHTQGLGRLIPVMWGLSGKGYFPDHRGFMGQVSAAEFNNPKYNYMNKTAYLHWIAMGY